MLTLDQVSKRVFSDPAWLVKCLIGGFFCMVPIINIWALGALYRLIDQGRRGVKVRVPEWEDWSRLFVDGLHFLLIAVVYGLGPIAVGWLVSLPLTPFLGPLARTLLVPGILTAAPLTAAGVYAYQRKNSLREILHPRALLLMLRSSGTALIIPTFAFLGALAVGLMSLALLPFAFFVAGAIVSYFYGSVFRKIEIAARRIRSH
jgi:hypothetical protein